MGLSLHSLTSVAILAVVFLNLFLLISTQELSDYKRLMSIFLVPLTLTTYGAVVFTGIIMMASRHLDFSIENIIMIVIALIYLYIEVKRIKSLKHMNETKDGVFDAYRPFARRLLQIEFLLLLLISLWMWLV
ncbi:hypothetical protein [uncultured Sulfurimonas sp.]